MFGLFARGQKTPPKSKDSRNTGRSLGEAKLSAWAIMVGERRTDSDPPRGARRPNRGMLDDLPQPEPAELAPMPTVRSFVELIGRMLAS